VLQDSEDLVDVDHRLADSLAGTWIVPVAARVAVIVGASLADRTEMRLPNGGEPVLELLHSQERGQA
jgi:hypothetical protein